MGLILGAPPRRCARGEKLAVVAATFSPGMMVTAIARDRGISRSILFAWRRQLRAEAGIPEAPRAPIFVTVTVRPDPGGFVGGLPAAVTGPGTISISFTDAARMRIVGGVDPAVASALVAALAAR